jgi:iron(III) transport system ATP-binding protein
MDTGADGGLETAEGSRPLALSGLVVRYGQLQALGEVNLEVAYGACLTIMGPTGAGKSTLLRAVAGLVEPAGGSIRWGTECWSDPVRSIWVPPERRRAGMVAQDPALWPHLTVAQHLGLALRWRGVERRRRREQVAEWLERVRLVERAGHRPGQLSGGEAQRLAVARALVGGARVLLLDEPLGQLDAELRPVLAVEIQRLARANQTTVLHVTHDSAEALSLGDRVAVMEAGRVVQCERPAHLSRWPRTRFVARATGHSNLLAPVGYRILCDALGLSVSAPPFAVLDDGTGALTPGMLALADGYPKASVGGLVTGARFEGSSWVAVVQVPALGHELQVSAGLPPAVGAQVRVIWREAHLELE